MNPYQVLGVPSNATLDQIKQRYKILAQHIHPDKDTGDEEKFKEINLAYEILTDPIRRESFDRTGSVDNTPSIKSAAYHKLSEIVLTLIHQFNPDGEDLILKIKFEVNNLKNMAHNDLNQCITFSNKLQKIASKIEVKNKDKENIIKAIVEKQLQQCEENKIEFNRRIELCDVITVILDDYNYNMIDLANLLGIINVPG